MPRINNPITAADVWAAATRTLSAFAAQNLFDIPAGDAEYPGKAVASSVTNNTYGSWVELDASVPAGSRLMGCAMAWTGLINVTFAQLSIGTGAAGSETELAAYLFSPGAESAVSVLYLPMWLDLGTAAVRLAARTRNNGSTALSYRVSHWIA